MQLEISNRLVISRAKVEDWKGIYELYSRLDPEDLYNRFFHLYKLNEDEAKKIAHQRDHVSFVAKVNNEVIGEASLYYLPDNCGEFSIVVDKRFRNLGIGRKLIEEIIKFSINHNFNKIIFYTLSSNAPMITLGRKLGFSITYEEDVVTGFMILNRNQSIKILN
jgi:Acetyltransferases